MRRLLNNLCDLICLDLTTKGLLIWGFGMNRIQYEITDKQEKALIDLMSKTGIRTKKELLSEALTFLEWAISEKEMGKIIVSLDEMNKQYKEVILHAFMGIEKGVLKKSKLVA